VDFFFRRLFENGLDVRALGHIKTAAIGPATADRLRTWGLKSDIIPQSYRAESVVEAFAAVPVKGRNILLPRAKEARSVLPVELTRMGAAVDEVTAYETRQAENSAADLIARLDCRHHRHGHFHQFVHGEKLSPTAAAGPRQSPDGRGQWPASAPSPLRRPGIWAFR
jgi:uroporphyrinogen-III synthase